MPTKKKKVFPFQLMSRASSELERRISAHKRTVRRLRNSPEDPERIEDERQTFAHLLRYRLRGWEIDRRIDCLHGLQK